MSALCRSFGSLIRFIAIFFFRILCFTRLEILVNPPCTPFQVHENYPLDEVSLLVRENSDSRIGNLLGAILAPICLITHGILGQLFRAVVLETVSAFEVSFSVICGMVDALQDCELVS